MEATADDRSEAMRGGGDFQMDQAAMTSTAAADGGAQQAGETSLAASSIAGAIL